MTEKLLIVLLIACIVMTAFSGCVQSSDGGESDITESESAVVEVSDFKVEEYKPEECDPEKDWKLVVIGEDIGYIKYNEEYRYWEIPLVVVFENLGVSVKWQSEEKAIIAVYDEECILDTSNGTLVREKDGFDYLECPPPGSLHPHERYFSGNGENFIIDSDYASAVILAVGYRLREDRNARTAEYVSRYDTIYSSSTGDYDAERILSAGR